MTMGQRIKELRLHEGWTQEELGKKLNLQKSAIAKYENGRVENLKASTILKMAEAFKVRPSYLMGWIDQAKQSDISEEIKQLLDPTPDRQEKASAIAEIIEIAKKEDAGRLRKYVEIFKAMSEMESKEDK